MKKTLSVTNFIRMKVVLQNKGKKKTITAEMLSKKAKIRKKIANLIMHAHVGIRGDYMIDVVFKEHIYNQ
jgi:hypothetical protein